MRNKVIFESLVEPEKYQVFLFKCPANVPYFFAAHTWLVVNNCGELSRWEVGLLKNSCEHSWTHLNKDKNPLFEGIDILPIIDLIPNLKGPKWSATLLHSTTGELGSTAEKMVKFILSSPRTYPGRDKYGLLGPNSNTYPQWVLDHFPEFKIELPRNAIGKNYKF